jgi:predicted ATPase
MTDTQALIERLTHCSQNTKDEYLHELTGRAATALTDAEAKLKTVLDREAETIRRYDAKLDDAGAKLVKARDAIQCLRNGYADAVAGYQYILQVHGRLRARRRMGRCSC